jgi:hypothetical protein
MDRLQSFKNHIAEGFGFRAKVLFFRWNADGDTISSAYKCSLKQWNRLKLAAGATGTGKN